MKAKSKILEKKWSILAKSDIILKQVIIMQYISVHETCRETYQARFYLIYNRTRNHGWNVVIMAETWCFENSLSDYMEASFRLRFNQ